MMSNLESMEHMAARLRGTGGGEQANAVIDAGELINKAGGELDNRNAVSAIFHLAVALVGEKRALGLLSSPLIFTHPTKQE